MMMRKKIYRIWLGPLPAWTPQFLATVERLKEHGWEFVIKNDPEELTWRCKEKLGIRMTGRPGTRKAGDYDPAIGELFDDELKGYHFWGHCGLDVVFGRLQHFLPDAFLHVVDVFGNDPDAICGPLSLYRNCAVVNGLYKTILNWQAVMEEPHIQAFDEVHMTAAVRLARAAGQLDFWSTFQQGHDKQAWHLPEPRLNQSPVTGELLDFPISPVQIARTAANSLDPFSFKRWGQPREIMMFHFNRKDRPPTWPIKRSS